MLPFHRSEPNDHYQRNMRALNYLDDNRFVSLTNEPSNRDNHDNLQMKSSTAFDVIK